MGKLDYLKEVKRTEPATPTHYTYDSQIEPGKVLVVRNVSLTWLGFKTTESAHFFIEDMGTKIFLGDDVPSVQSGHACWAGEVALGEKDRLGVYTPDSAAADVLYFHICGELYEIEDWRKK